MRNHICRLLTLDAFGTLFAPREPIAKQYADAARKHGLTGFTDDDVSETFRKAFREESKKHPNYGRAVDMQAPQWWANVINSSFQPFLPSSTALPKGLVPDLLETFSSSQGYNLYPDVLPFFRGLAKAKQRSHDADPSLIVAILTNSDDRVPQILSSFGLTVGPWRYGKPSPRDHDLHDVHRDLDFVALSYDIGFEKPDTRIFDATKRMVHESFDQDLECLHVGDDPGKDYHAAKAAGWQAVLLDRNSKYNDAGLSRAAELLELYQYLEF